MDRQAFGRAPEEAGKAARKIARKTRRDSIGPKQGDSLVIDHLSIGPEGIVMGPGVATNARITFIPAEVLLVPVRDRGTIYNVPKKHLGGDLGSATLLDVAQRAEGFLRGKLDEAASKF